MKTASILATGLMVFSLALTSSGGTADAGHRGRNTAIGVAAGIATLAIIAGASSRRAHADDYDDGEHHHHHSYRGRCERLLDRCNDGSDWACEKYETSGCSE